LFKLERVSSPLHGDGGEDTRNITPKDKHETGRRKERGRKKEGILFQGQIMHPTELKALRQKENREKERVREKREKYLSSYRLFLRAVRL